MIRPGTVAPLFSLPDQHGNTFDLSLTRGKHNVLLMFLPAAFTPICSTEVPALDAMLDRFLREADVWPFVIDVDNTHSNLAWSHQCGAPRVRILSDFYPHGAVSTKYGILAADGVSERSTVIIDKAGVVRYAVVAGRYGKRSIPELLAIATRINGGQPVANAGAVLPKLDLPVLYTTSTCPHCASVKAFLDESGLSQKVVVRAVDKDQVAMQELLSVNPEAGVPTLVMDGHVCEGDQRVIEELRAKHWHPSPVGV